MAHARRLEIYTDGSCLKNPGIGGWAFLIVDEDDCTTASGSAIQTTNQRMELTAALNALVSLDDGSSVNLYTDSRYLCDGMRSWVENWKRNNWVRPKLGPPDNLDLWQQLDEQNQRVDVQWFWVKAHNGNEFNERVDQLAHREARELQAKGESFG